jgi:tRNA A-37 threonylcarbamoyl transferase component Bud32
MTDSSADLSPEFSLDSFVRTTRKSGLIDPDRLQKLLDELPAEITGDAEKIAKQFVEQNLITDWQATKLLRGKHKGFSLGKYRLLRLLGKGGMSSVYLAEHTLMRRRCAIKVLPIGRVDDSSWLARFHREAQAIAALDHPNIVRAYDVDHERDGDRDIHFLVMEFVDGRSIQEIVTEDGPLAFDRAADFFRQAALGLEHAHRAGLIHRDVKPGNLLVDQQGVVKVLDLGLARFAEVAEEQPLTVTHDERVLGTADYLSPEQAIDSHAVDSRADIYSLGCSIYFALTGRPPFKDGSLAQRLMAHQMKDAPPISESRPEIEETEQGRALTAIIRRMMAREPDQRFQTMTEVGQALEDWLPSSSQSPPLAAPVVAPPVAVPVAQPVTAPPVAQPVAQPPVAQPVSSADNPPAAVPVAAPVVQPVKPAAPVTEAAPAFPAAPSIDIGAQTPTASPAEQDVQPVAVSAPASEAAFDPGLIPDVADGADEFPSILGGSPSGATVPQPPADVADFTATESFVPQEPIAADAPPGFPAFGDTPAFPDSAADVLPAVETVDDEVNTFDELLPDDDGPDELDRTIVTPGTGSSFQDILPPASSSEPPFPVAPASFSPEPAEPAFPIEQPTIPAAPAFDPAPAISSVPPALAPPVAEPAAFTPQPAVPVSDAPAFPSFDTPATDAGGFAPAAAPTFGEPAFGQPPVAQAPTSIPPAGQPPASSVPAPSRRKQGNPAMLIGGILAVLIIGGAVWFMMSGSDSKPSKSKTTASSGKSSSGSSKSKSGTSGKTAGSSTPVSSGALKTQLTVGPGREFKTIAAALAYVKTNKSRYRATTRKAVVSIEVAGSEAFNESIDIDNSGEAYPSGILIKSTNEFPFTLKPASGKPALRLVSIEHLQIENVEIAADGSDVAVELEGFLNRTSISNAKITGFKQTGVLGKGVAGLRQDELVLEQIDFRPAAPGAVGIKLTSGKASTGRIDIQDCRFFGPLSAGLLLNNGALGINVRRTIFDRADIGISFAGGPLEWRDVRIINCTFHEIGQTAINFADMPIKGSSGLEFRRNLFAGLKGPELKIASGYDREAFNQAVSTQRGSIEHNWTDNSQPANADNGERDLISFDNQRVSAIEFFSTDRDAEDFLTPRRGTPYASVGVRPGSDNDPFIGARPQPEPR